MNRKATPILLAIALVLGLLAFFSERSSTRVSSAAAAPHEGPRVLAINQSDILRVRVKRDYWNSYTLTRSADGSWKITDPSNEPASESAVRKLLTTLESLPATSTIDLPADDSERHRQYGLWNPALEISVQTSAGEQTLMFGSKTPDGKGIYCARVGDGRVYVTDVQALPTLSEDLAALRTEAAPAGGPQPAGG